MSDPAEDLKAVLARIPYARFLGVEAELHGDEMTAILPFSQHLIGNPSPAAIHGGVLGALMEITALAQLSITHGHARMPRVVDVTVQYLRSGKPLTTYARARIIRAGRRIANVHVECWQAERANPIASLHGHFLLSPKEEG
ncbi:MAG: thioesterase [Caulobacterales bacterium 32-69-10]|nr:MAG: thioesterase [Caulobacterales bacterium 32-69-10]